MAEIKLKVISASGDTLAVSRAGESISLVHTAPYADGDWIALKCDEPGLFCAVQLVDTMPPRLIYIKERGMDFLVPPADNRINYNPRGVIWRSIPMTATAATAFTRRLLPTWKPAERPCLPPATRWKTFTRMTPTALALPELGHQPRSECRAGD